MPDRLAKLHARREQLLAQAADLAAKASTEEQRLRHQAETLVGYLVTTEIEARSPAAERLRSELTTLLTDKRRVRDEPAREYERARGWLLDLLRTHLPAPAAGEPSRAARSRSSAKEPPPEGDLFDNAAAAASSSQTLS